MEMWQTSWNGECWPVHCESFPCDNGCHWTRMGRYCSPYCNHQAPGSTSENGLWSVLWNPLLYSLVLWNMNLIFPEYMGMSSSQLTKSYFSEGCVYHQPGNSWIWGKHGRRRAILAARGSRGGETRTKRMASDQSILFNVYIRYSGPPNKNRTV